jgi:hypothetical protein
MALFEFRINIGFSRCTAPEPAEICITAVAGAPDFQPGLRTTQNYKYMFPGDRMAKSHVFPGTEGMS